MTLHPNVHTPWRQWSEDQTLHVATAYSNPFRWRTRRELLNDFRLHMESSANVALHVGELAYGARPFEVTGGHPGDVQLRTSHELWHKENLLNLVVQRFPANWQYGAVIDGDFHMTRRDWALEAIHQLQHYDFVQLFSSYSDLTGNIYGSAQIPTRVTAGFAYNYIRSGYKIPQGFVPGGWRKDGSPGYYHGAKGLKGGTPVGATGGAWAFRRSAFEAVGGMLDVCILGHGDWFMAFGLVMEAAPEVGLTSYTSGYRRVIDAWQHNAARLKKNIGYIDNYALHFHHGSKDNRGYTTRYKVLVENGFDPVTDLLRNPEGVYQLAGNKPGLRDGIRKYMISRNEDSIGSPESSKALI